MRPIVVLSLVIAAVGVLVFALTRASGGSDERNGGIVRDTGNADSGSERAAALPVQPATSLVQAEVLPFEPEAVPVTQRQLATLPGLEPGEPTSWPNELRGRVLTPKNEPLEGARVAVTRQRIASQIATLQSMLAADDAPRAAARHVTTGEDGTFSLTSLHPGDDYTITIEHEEFQRAPLVNVTVQEQGVTELDIRMRRGWVLAGYVFDEAGEPIEGAKLELMPSVFANLPSQNGKERTPPGTRTTKSAVDGYYVFNNVDEGSRTLRCSLDGYGTRVLPNLRFSGRPKEPMLEDIQLGPARAIAGRVVGPDYAAIEGATVEAMYYGNGQNSRQRASTGPGGTFRIDNLLDAPYLILASAEGYTQFRQNQVEAGTKDLVIELGQQGGVQGRVVDRATGAPLDAFVCNLRKVDPKQGFYGHVLKKLAVNEAEDGAFEIPAVPDGKFVVLVDAPRFASTYSAPFDVTQGLITTDVVVSMGRGGSIVGFLIDKRSREPVRGAKITTFDNTFVENPLTDLLGSAVPRATTARTVQSDAEGRFELPLLTPETYQIHVDHPAYTQRIFRDLVVTDGLPTTVPTVQMTVGALVTGTVYGEDGQPLSSAKVELRGAGGVELLGRVYEDVTDASGKFSIPRVAAGTYKLSATSAEARMGNPFKTIIEMQNSETSLTVVEGREYTKEVRLGS